MSFLRKSLRDRLNLMFVLQHQIKGNAGRNEHLRTKDLFEGCDFLKIFFQSNSVIEMKGTYRAFINLFVLGITKAVTFSFLFFEGSFEGQFTVNRLDLKLSQNFPAYIVGNPIRIQSYYQIIKTIQK